MAQLNSTIINGGLVVSEDIIVGGETTISSSKVSTATTNGALVVTGGVGVANNLNVGGNTNISSKLTANGGADITGDLTLFGGIKHPNWEGAHSLTIYNGGSRNEASIRYTTKSSNPGDQTNSWVVGLNAGSGQKEDHFGWWCNGLNDMASKLLMELGPNGHLYLGAGTDGNTKIELDGGNGNIISTGGTIEANTFTATSDARLKENLVKYEHEKSILDLPIYKYDFINGNKNQIGCLAQDLQEICPEIVNENENGYLSIQESKLVYLLLDEVKKLKVEVEELKAKQ